MESLPSLAENVENRSGRCTSNGEEMDRKLISSAIQVVETARQNMLRAIKAGAKSISPILGRAGRLFVKRQPSQQFKTPLEVIHFAQLFQSSFESRRAGAEWPTRETFRECRPTNFRNSGAFAVDRRNITFLTNTMSTRRKTNQQPRPSATPTTSRVAWPMSTEAVPDIGGGSGSAGRLWATKPISQTRCVHRSATFRRACSSRRYTCDPSSRRVPHLVDTGAIWRRPPPSESSYATRVFLLPVHNSTHSRDRSGPGR